MLDPFEPESKADPISQHGDDVPSNESTGWLLNPRCKLDGAAPEKRKTKHLYIRLDMLQSKIADWFKTASQGWTANAVSTTKTWLDKGLQPRPITRDLRWGVPIPQVEGLNSEEYKAKVFYVWFDACIGYMSASTVDFFMQNSTNLPLDYKDLYRWRGPRWSEVGAMVEKPQGRGIIPIHGEG